MACYLLNTMAQTSPLCVLVKFNGDRHDSQEVEVNVATLVFDNIAGFETVVSVCCKFYFEKLSIT